MTVLTNGAPIVTARGSVLGAFAPKPRPGARADARRKPARRPVGDVLRQHRGHIKDFVVATAAAASGTVAAFQWHPWAGWLALGVSFLLVDRAVDRDEAVSADERAG